MPVCEADVCGRAAVPALPIIAQFLLAVLLASADTAGTCGGGSIRRRSQLSLGPPSLASRGTGLSSFPNEPARSRKPGQMPARIDPGPVYGVSQSPRRVDRARSAAPPRTRDSSCDGVDRVFPVAFLPHSRGYAVMR